LCISLAELALLRFGLALACAATVEEARILFFFSLQLRTKQASSEREHASNESGA
jgi:hypothetical protein